MIERSQVQVSPTIIVIIIIIIIITNEKTKVMLSQKRCRGTLQGYNKGVFHVVFVTQNSGCHSPLPLKLHSVAVYTSQVELVLLIYLCPVCV